MDIISREYDELSAFNSPPFEMVSGLDIFEQSGCLAHGKR
jgi:hypothetical protein